MTATVFLAMALLAPRTLASDTVARDGQGPITTTARNLETRRLSATPEFASREGTGVRGTIENGADQPRIRIVIRDGVQSRADLAPETVPGSVPELLEPPKIYPGAPDTDAGGEDPPPVRALPPPPVIIDAICEKFRAETGRKPEARDIVGALNRSTVGLLREGKYRLAERAAKTALELAERELGGEDPDTLVSINNLANLYSLQGRPALAEPLLTQAMETSQRVLGAAHPNTLTAMNALAFLYEAQGQDEKALPLLERILEVRERTLGPDHADTRNSLENLAGLYRSRGYYRKAESLYVRALESGASALGERHPDILAIRLSLAITRVLDHNFAPALQALRRMDADLGRIISKMPADAREEARQWPLAFRSQVHDVIFSLTLMEPPEDIRIDVLGLVARILLRPDPQPGDGDVAMADRVGEALSPVEPDGLPADGKGRARALIETISMASIRKAPPREGDPKTRGDAGLPWAKAFLTPGAAILRLRAFHPVDPALGSAGRYWLVLIATAGEGGELEMALEDLGPKGPDDPASLGRLRELLSEYFRVFIVTD